jgi:hypothetical protein
MSNNYRSGNISHAEGYNGIASGVASHAEGSVTPEPVILITC